MIKISPRSRRCKGRHRPSFDLLEDRVALAAVAGTDQTDPNSSSEGTPGAVADLTQGQPFSVELVDPAPGLVFHDSPSSLNLQFNHPIFPDTLSFDVGIIQTDSDGNPTGWYVVPDPGQVTLDDSATRLSVSVGQTLPPGDFQVWILGSSGITDIDGNLLIPDGNPLVLGAFDVIAAGVTLGDAADLPTPGPTPITVTGTLDFQTNPYAVALYRIQLDQGHFWRLGLEVTAERDGGTLDTALALFDAQGQPIATDETGRVDDPQDPFLFAGLQPGAYYVGVSGTTDLPGAPGGYDPVTGSPGSVVQTQPGGTYTLHVVADSVDSPPQVRSFSVDHADSHSATPTGLTLEFTRAISLSGQIGNLSPEIAQGIEVTDGEGRNWPVQASGYNEAGASVSYLFEGPLPAGHYTVQLPPLGGLVDLAGLSPMAPGEPAGVLGDFDVSTANGSSDPDDLGAILPGASAAGRSIALTLEPGNFVTYRVVLTVPAIYQFDLHSDAAFLSAQLTSAGATQFIDSQGTSYAQLVPGEYSIRIQNIGTDAIHAQLGFRAADVITELFLASGVGQGPGLSLRLIAYPNSAIQSPSGSPVLPPPTATLPSPIETPVATQPTANAIDPGARERSVRVFSSSPSLSAGGPVIRPVATITFLGMGSDLIGRPSQPGLHGSLSDLGISSQLEVILLGGIVQGQQPSMSRDLWTRRDTAEPEVVEVVAEAIPAGSDSMTAVAGFDPIRVIPFIGGLLDWTVRMTAAASARFAAWPSTRPSSDAPRAGFASSASLTHPARQEVLTDGATDLDQVETMIDETESRVEFLAPVLVALSVAVVAQMSRYLARWWMSRDRSRVPQATRQLDRGSVPSEPVPPYQVDSWFDESELDEDLLPVSRAS
jgi:hypothetical protein